MNLEFWKHIVKFKFRLKSQNNSSIFCITGLPRFARNDGGKKYEQ